ncbi:VAM5/VAMP75 protein [Gonium pectorale]|uniref:VAM5/VAMP75 protein n=1 Tax=Gonium pectorale TaxID=33097 RepID=A0A150FWN3_GONPE|nr:VAM5/VAMP75 protein [Gonium pectorale]|eukprot:KXZ42022.1 VAM5/VAMP75 protein [Gonium pectorale]
MAAPGAPRILYSLVARGQVVLAEHSVVTGNCNVIAVRILEKLPQDDTRVSYTQERHMFHVMVAEGITYMAVAEEAFGRRIPFAFLEDVRGRFVATYGAAAKEAVAYEYNTEFSRVLAERAGFFSDPSSDIINRVKGELQEVKHIMIENIEKVLERGERLDLLVDKTEGLQQVSLAFRREARRLRTTMWWKNMRLWLVVSGSVAVLIYLIVAMACGFTLRRC